MQKEVNIEAKLKQLKQQLIEFKKNNNGSDQDKTIINLIEQQIEKFQRIK